MSCVAIGIRDQKDKGARGLGEKCGRVRVTERYRVLRCAQGRQEQATATDEKQIPFGDDNQRDNGNGNGSDRDHDNGSD
jgi:hypothetical protein